MEEVDWSAMKKSMGNMSVGCVQPRGCTPKILNALQRYAVEETRLGIPFLFSEEALHGFYDEKATCFPQQISLAGTFEPELGKKMGACIAAEARAYGVHETFSPVMDLTAVSRLYGSHYTASSPAEAIRQGLEAGVDLQLYDFTHEEWEKGIRSLIETGKMSEAVLNQACGRVLKLKFALGLFEHPYVDESLYEKTADCAVHQETALEIARKSICLLKNDRDILPLSQNLKRIAVVGPGAAEPALGDYCTNFEASHMVTVLDGIRELVSDETEVIYEKGCSYLGEKLIPFHPGWFVSEDGRTGLTGRYYNGWDMKGEPIATRLDQMIQFNWIYAKPHPDLDASRFSVVWTGKLKAPESFCGCIGLSSQDSMRLYVDGELVIDGWGSGKDSGQLVDFTFEIGREYEIRLEFCNDARGARVVFGYNRGRESSAKAVEAVKRADIAVVCLGDSVETCGENLDRADLQLPGRQLDFLKELAETKTPIVLVLQNGRPLSLVWEQEHIPAILECWYPGEKGCRVSVRLGTRQLRTLNMKYEWHVEPGDFTVMVGDNAANVLLKGKFTLA